ncbi:N-acetylmuramoyl-L-alanine amidase family protein [Extibacter muris]|uniref:peptidoglycan recognition protein family protein n=1 Tax=Extibacter muris TaxID=1796622 RepID=UPI001D07D26F|nr:peptidoglycan recognition family protein [Extibacter muris]MCB6201087.1 N-acetylmuramoyl-L-alanine amidase [Extibacter muris]MCQ4662417.1 N-acetylmuramoyl-L-alanine amidase [Extibacter muris]MCQ4691656.1 N-acetylmuramoyl-L-alanine amidase [Extibacter muris]
MDRRIAEARCRRMIQRNVRLGILVLVVLIVLVGILRIVKPAWFTDDYIELKGSDIDASRPDLDVELLTENPYSRPGTKTDKIKGIVVHYTANPGATAMDNRNYFEGLKDSHETKASSNFIVGLEGEIVQCVPTWEVAYASNSRNNDTVSIECCHPDETGKFNDETYKSMVRLCAWLCMKFDLDSEDVIRHYDVTEKNCPKYFVENEDAWKQFRADVQAAIER